MSINGKPGKIEKVDETTVRFEFPEPYYLLPGRAWPAARRSAAQATRALTRAGGGYAPAHYLKQFLPEVRRRQGRRRQAKATPASTTGSACFKFKDDWPLNPELPVVTPWKTVTPINTPTWTLERNPYSICGGHRGQPAAVHRQDPDDAGREPRSAQPARHRRRVRLAGAPHRPRQAAGLPGEPAEGQLQRPARPGGNGADCGIFSSTRATRPTPRSPSGSRNVDFRRALSLGIDRDQLNETFWLGHRHARLGAPSDESHKYSPGPSGGRKWATLDVEAGERAAGQGIGLTKKDAEGFRLRTDNGQGACASRSTTLRRQFVPFTRIGEMIREQWKKIGIQARRQGAWSAASRSSGASANEHQIGVDAHWGTENMFAHPLVSLFPFDPTSQLGPLYGAWFATGGAQGKEPPGKMKEVMELYREAFSAPEKEHIELGKEIWKIALDELWAIGTVGQSPGVMGVRVVKNNMGNQPSRISTVQPRSSPAQAQPGDVLLQVGPGRLAAPFVIVPRRTARSIRE